MKNNLSFFCLMFIAHFSYGQNMSKLDSLLPVRGFCIAAPQAQNVDRFIDFMKNDLHPNHINTLILRVDYNYQYESYPNLGDSGALSKTNVKKIVAEAQKLNIRLIPQINLLGHQSWASNLGKLLAEYPEFDETPHVKMPEKYEWPNEDGLYCKSYCPLHPDIHKVVFALIDEIVDVFEADAFHAGMDEVFYIGDDNCPRCSGKNKAELFAGEVTKIKDHLAARDKELWIWGDRLLDGETTGLGMWEASINGTYPAIDLIPKDVIICDWHYERAEPTAAYFALKGFKVITCPWNRPDVAKDQLSQILELNKTANTRTSERVLGMVETIWRDPSAFLNDYDQKKDSQNQAGDVLCTKALFEGLSDLIK